MQAPASQIWFPPQTVPHFPQLFLSLLKSGVGVHIGGFSHLPALQACPLAQQTLPHGVFGQAHLLIEQVQGPMPQPMLQPPQ